MPIKLETLPEKLSVERSGTVFIHRIWQPILSKRDLQVHFQLSDLRALRRKVLTNDILSECSISAEEYHAKWSFTAAQSARLYEVLGIVWLRTNLKG